MHYRRWVTMPVALAVVAIGLAPPAAVSTMTITAVADAYTAEVAPTVTDSGGRSSTDQVTVAVAADVEPRFPGDPGPGRLMIGVNNVVGSTGA